MPNVPTVQFEISLPNESSNGKRRRVKNSKNETLIDYTNYSEMISLNGVQTQMCARQGFSWSS